MRRVLGLLACVAISASAVAADGASSLPYADTGSSLLSECNHAIESRDAVSPARLDHAVTIDVPLCFGYLQGVRDLSGLERELQKSPLFCIPDEVRPIQVVRVVHNYLSEHPADLQQHRMYLANKALQ